MNNEEKKADKATITEKERFKGKMTKVQNKAQATVVKARRRNQGHEPVSDQKSHEYH
jgi:hypothetical protein